MMMRAVLGLMLTLGTFADIDALEIVWTRTTGQYPVECTPVRVHVDGKDKVIALNRGGQLMVWNADGTNGGDGQDGAVAQLPEGFWSSTPLVGGRVEEPYVVVCSGEGLVIALNGGFGQLWQVQLPGETVYGGAIPVRFPNEHQGGPGYCISDKTGSVTCVNADGTIRWQRNLGYGSCRTPLARGVWEGAPALLAAAGNTLVLLDRDGNEIWSQDIGIEITAGPIGQGTMEKALLVCGGRGRLVALNLSGEILWTAPASEEMDNAIMAETSPTGTDVIVSKGLWGDLSAYSISGKRLWTHAYRAKSRGAPVFTSREDFFADWILSTSYDQQARLFDRDGRLVDLCRLAGAVSGSPVLMSDPDTGEARYLVVTASLLAHCLRVDGPEVRNEPSQRTGDVALEWRSGGGQEALIVRNEAGRRLVANVSVPTADGTRVITGAVTTRSVIEIPFDPAGAPDGATVIANVVSASGNDLVNGTWPTAANRDVPAIRVEDDELTARPIPAYGEFDPNVVRSPSGEEAPGIEVPNLYVNEIDQGAFVVESSYSEPMRVRIRAGGLTSDSDATPFGGSVCLYEVVFTGAFNGEDVADALVSLGDSGIVTLTPGRVTKIWVQVDGHGTEPGAYSGTISVQPVLDEVPSAEIGLSVSVPDLRMETPFPLTLCTWDYVPNQWFPNRTTEVLDDMARHGVNVFPRSVGIPPATADASGTLQCDWSAMEAQLAPFNDRGAMLFQMTAPPVTFAESSEAVVKRRCQITYLQQWRDHLRELGWGYEDYALYPVDEPGLDYGKRIQTFLDAALLFRAADPQLRIYTDPVPGLSLADFERIAPYVDVWCPNMRLVSGLLAKDPRMERIMDSGKVVWSYECVAQVRSLSPLRYNRANAWRAHHFGLDGIGFWTHCTTPNDPWLRAKDFNEYELVYPGDLPVPSVRWEAARDGLEDVAAIAMLEEAIAAAKAAGVKPELVAEAENVLRIAVNDVLELSDDAFKETRDYLREGDRRVWHTASDVALYARHRTRIAALTLALVGE